MRLAPTIACVALAVAGCAPVERGGLYFSDGGCHEHELIVACSPLAETCGCSPGRGCRSVGPGGRTCTAAADVEPGGRCLSDAECRSDAWCVSGVCREVCDLHLDGFPCAAGPCARVTVDGEAISDLGACADDGCDPIAQTGCAEGLECQPGHARDGVYSTCEASIEGAGFREPCDERSCAPGLVCIATDAAPLCRALCDVRVDDACADFALLGDARCTGVLGGVRWAAERALGYCAG